MRKLLITLLITLLVALPVIPARAQNTVRFSKVEVNLWPEYDRVAVLVIYRISLSSDTALPVDLTVRIPVAAGEPNAVAVQELDGKLVTVNFERETSGDWQVLSFTATMPDLQIEYYDPGLAKNGTQRTFSYVWPADHAVDAMQITFQQPLDGSDMTITPGPVTSQVGGDGLTYFFKDIGPVAIDQSFTLEASYQKSSDELTVAAQPVQPTTPLETTPAWLTSLENALPWLAGVLGLILIGGGVYWYWRTGQQRQEESGKRRTRRGRSTAETRNSGSEMYCHQCGHRAGAGDRFCRACGEKLRLE